MIFFYLVFSSEELRWLEGEFYRRKSEYKNGTMHIPGVLKSFNLSMPTQGKYFI